MNRFVQTFDGIMKSNLRSYEKYKLFIMEIVVDLIIKNQRNHENHYASQQRLWQNGRQSAETKGVN